MIKKAFTLLEMLVVIGIIGILVGLGAVSYSTAQKKARDAKRKQDLKAVQNCLEQYYSYNNNFKYPDYSSWPSSFTSFNCGSSTLTAPSDPRNSSPYVYTISSSSDAYTICATLETESPSSYCLKNQQ
jgi:type IV pilus assembly protein PilE